MSDRIEGFGDLLQMTTLRKKIFLSWPATEIDAVVDESRTSNGKAATGASHGDDAGMIYGVATDEI